jgi:hypothetical protein
MLDLIWSLWQSARYPPHSTNPPCLFVPNPATQLHTQYQEFSNIPPKQSGTTRVVFISDTHGRHSTITVPPCDVLCHCGDIMFMGRKFSSSFCRAQYAAFDAWMVEYNQLHF